MKSRILIATLLVLCFSLFVACPNPITTIATTIPTPTPVPVILPPANLKAIPEVDGVTFSWDAVTNATSYKLYSADSSFDFSLLAEITSTTSYKHTEATNSTNYYRITAVVNGTETSPSALISASLTALLAPDSILTTPNYDGVQISWTAVIGATNYKIFYADSSYSSTWTLLATLTETEYQDAAAAAVLRYYRVQAMNATNTGIQSVAVSGKRMSPSIPTGLVGSNISGSDFNLSWTAAAGADSYEILRSSSASYVVIGNASTPSFHDIGGIKAGYYNYRIVSIHGSTPNIITRSDQSAALNCYVLGKAPTISTIDNGGSMKVTWYSGSAPATVQAEIQRSTESDSGFVALGATIPLTNNVYLDSTATPGIQYYYRMILSQSGIQSLPSEVAAGKVSGIVQQLSATVGTVKNAISLTWDSLGSYADSYIIYASPDGVSAYLQIASVSGAVNSYTSTTNVGTGKYFKVAGKLGSVEGSQSVAVYGEAYGRAPPAPNASAVGTFNLPVIKISWATIPGAKRYLVGIYDDLGSYTGYVVGDANGVTANPINWQVSTSLGVYSRFCFSVTGIFTASGTPSASDYSEESPLSNLTDGY